MPLQPAFTKKERLKETHRGEGAEYIVEYITEGKTRFLNYFVEPRGPTPQVCM